MKNLPENNFWNNIKDRLDHYAEEPADDSWDNIAGALGNTKSPKIFGWLDRRASSSAINLPGIALLVAMVVGGDQHSTTMPNATVAIQDPCAETSYTSRAAIASQQQEVVQTPGNRSNTVQPTQGDDSPQQTEPASSTSAVQKENKRAIQGNHANNRGQQHKAINSDHTEKQGKLNTRADASNETERTAEQHANTGMESVVIAESEAVVQAETGAASKNRAGGNQGNGLQKEEPTDTVVQKNALKKEDVPVVAKKEEAEQKKKSKRNMPAIYFQAGPALAYHKVTPEESDDVEITALEKPGIFASDRLGLSVEAGFQYRVLPRLEVYAGLSYYTQRQHIRYTRVGQVPAAIEGTAKDGYVITPDITEHEVYYGMRNAGVSGGMFYLLKAHQLEHKIGLGLLYQRGFMHGRGEGNTYTNTGSSYFQYQLSYRLEAALNNRMRIFFQPSYTHAFRTQEKLKEPFTLTPYRAGISVGVVYHF